MATKTYLATEEDLNAERAARIAGDSSNGSGPLGYPTNPVTNAAAARPSLTVVYWQTATQPTNLAAGDIWIKTA